MRSLNVALRQELDLYVCYRPVRYFDGVPSPVKNPEKVNMPGSVVIRLNNHEPSALQISDYLFRWGIQSLFIEGGAQVLSHFISTGFWDEAKIFTGNQDFKRGVKAPEINGILSSSTKFSNSSLEVFING